MVRYHCARCGEGEHLSMLYRRGYRKGERNGAFIPLVMAGVRIGHCGNCQAIVPAALKARRSA